jgi:hypothetical protein
MIRQDPGKENNAPQRIDPTELPGGIQNVGGQSGRPAIGDQNEERFWVVPGIAE